MMAHPGDAASRYFVGQDARGTYIGRRSNLEMGGRRIAGKHVGNTDTTRKAERNRDAIRFSNWEVGNVLIEFTARDRNLDSWGNPKVPRLSSSKANKDTYIKVAFPDKEPTLVLKRFEQMSRQITRGKTPLLESDTFADELAKNQHITWKLKTNDADNASIGSNSSLTTVGCPGGDLWLGTADEQALADDDAQMMEEAEDAQAQAHEQALEQDKAIRVGRAQMEQSLRVQPKVDLAQAQISTGNLYEQIISHVNTKVRVVIANREAIENRRSGKYVDELVESNARLHETIKDITIKFANTAIAKSKFEAENDAQYANTLSGVRARD
jgi:hypothetical protein